MGTLGSDFGVTWFCGPSPFYLLLWDLVSDVRRFDVVLGPTWETLLILCCPLGRGLGFGMGLIVPHLDGGWGLVRISYVVIVSVLGISSNAGTYSSGHTWHCRV